MTTIRFKDTTSINVEESYNKIKEELEYDFFEVTTVSEHRVIVNTSAIKYIVQNNKEADNKH